MANKSVRLAIGWVLTLIAGAAPLHADARLYAADAGNGGVKLQWHPLTWAETQIGFTLKRRVAGELAWMPLAGAQNLRPEVDYGRNWTKLGFDSGQASEIRQHIVEARLNTRPTMDADKVREGLYQAKSLPAGDAIQMMRDAANAFAWGLGYIDNTVLADNDYEYGLFEVNEKGEETTDPVSITQPLMGPRRADWFQITKTQLAPNLSPNQLSINWRMPLAEARRSAIGKFLIERRIGESKEWTTVNPEVPYHIVRQSEARWMAFDTITPEMRSQPIHYRLTAVDMFQSPLPAFEYTISSVEPIAPDAAKHGPVRLQAKVESGKIILDWEQGELTLNYMDIKEFRLKEQFGFESVVTLGGAAARRAIIESSNLRQGAKYVVDAVYADWDGYEQPVSSVQTFDFSALIADSLKQ